MNLKLKHEDLVPNYNAIITLIFIFYYRLHCFSVPTTPEQRKTTSSSLAGERGGGGARCCLLHSFCYHYYYYYHYYYFILLLVVLTDDKAIKEPRTVDQTDRIIC